MSKFVLTVVDDPDYKVSISDYTKEPGIYITCEERKGSEGLVVVATIAISSSEIDTLIKRLKTAKDILEEEDDD